MEQLIFENFLESKHIFSLLIAMVYTRGEYLGCDCACKFLNVSSIEA